MAAQSDEYVPRKKSFKDATEENIEEFTWMDLEDDGRVSEAEGINNKLLNKYPDEYRQFRNEILSTIKPKLVEEFDRAKEIYGNKLDKKFAKELEVEQGGLMRMMEQNMEDEIRKTTAKELKYAERRKEAECKRAYAKIKSEVMKAKEEGVKICLHCGESNARQGCECNQAFYCNKTCLKKHLWIHKKSCTEN